MAERKNKFQDSDCVYIKRPVRAKNQGRGKDCRDFPAGTIGGIIYCFANAYLVEFAGDPEEDGFIYTYYDTVIKEEDLELCCRGKSSVGP